MNNQGMMGNDSKIKNFIVKYYPLFFIVVVLTFIAITAYKIMEFPYFFFSDQVQHFDTMNGVRGALFYPIGGGRFFPLVFFEFYPVLMSGMSLENIEFFIYGIQASKFVVFSLLLFYMLKLYSNSKFIAFLGFSSFIFLSSVFSFNHVFSHTIFAEPMLLLMLTTFCIFYFHAKATDKWMHYIFALLAMTYALYLKEPVFSSFVVFALMRLFFFRTEISRREKYFQYIVLLNCVIFLCLYYLFAYTSGSTYAEGRVQGDYFELLKKILIDYRFIIPVIIAFGRLYFVVSRKSKVMLADVFLLMSLAYMSCFVVLFLNNSYYFLPVYFLLWPAFALYTKQILEIFGCKFKIPYCFFALVLLALLLSFFLVRSPFRENFMATDKILNQEQLKIVREFREQGKNVVFYTLLRDEYEVPFHHAADGWVFALWDGFLDNYKNVTRNKSMTRVELSEFNEVVDGGGIGVISSITPQTKSMMLENYPQYELINFGMSFLVVHREHLASIAPLYCDFASNLDKKSAGLRGHDRTTLKRFLEGAKEKGLRCDTSL